MVETTDHVFYVDGLSAWPPARYGQSITVTGTVEKREGLDEEAATHVAGIVGTYYLLRTPKVHN